MLDACRAIFLVGVLDGFRIRVGPKLMSARGQRLLQFTMVVDFAVEENVARAVLVRHRLRAADAIDNRQAGMTERRSRIREEAFAVWTAMRDGARHRRHGRGNNGIERTGNCEYSANAAH